MSTYYAVLELSEQATPDDIRRAYRRLVQLTHPDRTPDPAAHRRYLAVNEACETLSNPARRQQYDRQLHELRHPIQFKAPVMPPTQRPRRPPPSAWRQRTYAPPRLDFNAYATAARRWGERPIGVAFADFPRLFCLAALRYGVFY
jgi:curved DNA-binding protein CbpA